MTEAEEMADIEVWLGGPLPRPYRDFLEAHANSRPVGDLVLLYGKADIRDRNETFSTREYCPGFVAVGDDSGGRLVLLPLSGGPLSLVDAGAMSPEWAHPLAEDFAAWFAAGCPLPKEDGEL